MTDQNDKLAIAYLIDAVKYLCRGDSETAQRSLDHAKSHLEKSYKPAPKEHYSWANCTNWPQANVAPLGYCPRCGAMGVLREKRPDGNDECANRHIYPSKDALQETKLAPEKT